MEKEIELPDLSFKASKVNSEIVQFYAKGLEKPPDLNIFRQIEDAGKRYLNQLFLQALRNPSAEIEKIGVVGKCEVRIDKITDLRLLADRLSDQYFGFRFSMLKVQQEFTPRETIIVIYFY